MEKKKFVLEGGDSKMEIRKVLIRRDGIKYIIVPKNSCFNKGDYLVMRKLREVNDE